MTELLLRFFKTLADDTRLRMVGVLAARMDEPEPRRWAGVEELATIVGVKPPTASHHLTRLRELGIVVVRSEGTSRLYRLDPDALQRLAREVLEPERMAAAVEEPRSWDDKVLSDFMEGDRLKQIPVGVKKRLVVLRWLAERFERGRTYTEREVNDILGRHHEDVAYLRRELVSETFGLMKRSRGVYERV